MRLFEATPNSTVVLRKKFVKNNTLKISSSDVLVSIYSVHEKGEMEETDIASYSLEAVMVLKQVATYDSGAEEYQYSLGVTNWDLGSYLIKWTATIDGVEVDEWDKIYIVVATMDAIVSDLDMPSSVSAGGVTLSYGDRARNRLSMRPPRVGIFSKNRSMRRTGGERDYNRR